jgi:hypothetical protein
MKQTLNWSEDFNETLNYWFWRRRIGKLPDRDLMDRVRQTLALSSLEGNREVSGAADFKDYLMAWREWTRDQFRQQTARTEPKLLRAHYKSVEATGASLFTVQWVMAMFGERWLLRPRVILLGADGGSPDARRAAVLAGAKALVASSDLQ